MAGKIQNEDIKSAAELVSAGATAASLPNDDKVYVTANAINKTLKQAIIDGNIASTSVSYKPTENILSAMFDTQKTIIARGTVLGGSTPSLGGSHPTNTPATPTSAIITPSGTGSIPAAAGSAPTLAGGTPSATGGAVINNLGALYVQFQQAASLPAGVSSSTASMQSGTATPVSNGVFDLQTSTLSTGSNNIQTKILSGSPGTASDFTLSNILPITANKITNTQVTNTNPTGPDYQYGYGAPPNQTSPQFIQFNSALFFLSYNSNMAAKLFKVTTGNVVTQISNIANDQTLNDFGPIEWSPIVFNSFLYFWGYDATTGLMNIYKVSTANAVTKVTAGLNPPPANLGAQQMFLFNSKLYFLATEATNTLTTGGLKLWALTTADAISLVTNNVAGGDDFDPGCAFSPIIFNTSLYFIACSAAAILKVYKLTTGGALTLVSNTFNATGATDFPNGNIGWSPVIMSSALYFVAYNPNSVLKMFKCTTSDVITQASNTTGDQAAGDFTVGGDGFANGPCLILFNSVIYFAAFSQANIGGTHAYKKLFKIVSAGTVTQISNTAGSQYVKDIELSVSGFWVFNNQLFFASTTQYNQAYTDMFKMSTSDVITPALSTYGTNYGNITINYPLAINGTTSFYFSLYAYDEVPELQVGFSGMATTTQTSSIYKYLANDTVVRVSKTAMFGVSDMGFVSPPSYVWKNNTPGVFFNSKLYFWGTCLNGFVKLFTE